RAGGWTAPRHRISVEVRMKHVVWLAFSSAAAVVACGSKVMIESPGAGGHALGHQHGSASGQGTGASLAGGDATVASSGAGASGGNNPSAGCTGGGVASAGTSGAGGQGSTCDSTGNCDNCLPCAFDGPCYAVYSD